MDGVVPAGEGVLWPGGGGPSACTGPPRLMCWRWGWPAALDPLGQAEHGQSQGVARTPRGDLGEGAGWGLVPRPGDAPEDLVRGGGVPYCPWRGGPWGEHGVCPLDDSLWAGGCCCGDHYVVVPTLEDYAPDLRRGGGRCL